MRGDGFRARENIGIDAEFAHIGGDGFGVEAVVVAELFRIVNAAENHFVSGRKRLWQSFLENFAAHGVGARLENGPQTASGPAAACSGDGGANGGGMVREI